jgi:hypothetical protein
LHLLQHTHHNFFLRSFTTPSSPCFLCWCLWPFHSLLMNYMCWFLAVMVFTIKWAKSCLDGGEGAVLFGMWQVFYWALSISGMSLSDSIFFQRNFSVEVGKLWQRLRSESNSTTLVTCDGQPLMHKTARYVL